MGRLACVDVPALALQLLVRRQASWRGEAVAVVDRDAAQGLVLWVNERARRHGVLPGLRHAAALALCAELRAGEVARHEIEGATADLTECLRRFSPHVEPSTAEPGVFWVDLTGLGLLHPSLVQWAHDVRAALAREGFRSAVVIGFQRFRTYAIAKTARDARPVVLGDAREEEERARRVPLARLDVDPEARRELARLGVDTLGDLLRLPAESVLVRFGEELHRVHRLAAGALAAPLEPLRPAEPVHAAVDLDHPLGGVEPLVALASELARPLLARLAAADQAVRRLELRLVLEDASAIVVRVETTEPTLAEARLARLLRLRLEHTRLGRGVERVELEIEPARSPAEQGRLFLEHPGRDLRGAARAFAAIRAAFGDDAVVRARILSAHLPEAGFRWERLDEARAPQPGDAETPTLIRRIRARPLALRPRPAREEDWMPRGAEHGRIVKLDGPYALSGGWWRAESERDYYYAHLESGAIAWIYYDRRRKRWMLQGGAS